MLKDGSTFTSYHKYRKLTRFSNAIQNQKKKFFRRLFKKPWYLASFRVQTGIKKPFRLIPTKTTKCSFLDQYLKHKRNFYRPLFSEPSFHPVKSLVLNAMISTLHFQFYCFSYHFRDEKRGCRENVFAFATYTAVVQFFCRQRTVQSLRQLSVSEYVSVFCWTKRELFVAPELDCAIFYNHKNVAA